MGPRVVCCGCVLCCGCVCGCVCGWGISNNPHLTQQKKTLLASSTCPYRAPSNSKGIGPSKLTSNTLEGTTGALGCGFLHRFNTLPSPNFSGPWRTKPHHPRLRAHVNYPPPAEYLLPDDTAVTGQLVQQLAANLRGGDQQRWVRTRTRLSYRFPGSYVRSLNLSRDMSLWVEEKKDSPDRSDRTPRMVDRKIRNLMTSASSHLASYFRFILHLKFHEPWFGGSLTMNNHLCGLCGLSHYSWPLEDYPQLHHCACSSRNAHMCKNNTSEDLQKPQNVRHWQACLTSLALPTRWSWWPMVGGLKFITQTAHVLFPSYVARHGRRAPIVLRGALTGVTRKMDGLGLNRTIISSV